MSNPAVDYAELLREAVKQAKASAPRAVDDLFRCASQAAEAVDGVTRGAAALELVPVNQDDNARPTYQLQLRKVASDAPASDLGVYSVAPSGYPIQYWYWRSAWEEHPEKPGQQYLNSGDLEDSFKWVVSSPESRLVVLVTFFQQQEGTSPQ
jgi:hypothetical protein